LLETYITFLERREHGSVVSLGRSAARKQNAAFDRRLRSAKLEFNTQPKPIISGFWGDLLPFSPVQERI
jgi:hypothetical protein